MPPAEWFEEQANKIKLKTWIPSEQHNAPYNEYNRLGLILAEKYKDWKPIMLKIDNDPNLKANMTDEAKRVYDSLKKFNPDYFKVPAPLVAPKTPAQTAQNALSNKLIQAQQLETQPKWTASDIKAYQDISSKTQDPTDIANQGLVLSSAPKESKATKFWAGVREEFNKSLLPTFMNIARLPYSMSSTYYLTFRDLEDKYVAEQIGVPYELFKNKMSEPYNQGYITGTYNGKQQYISASQWKQLVTSTPEGKKAAVGREKQSIDAAFAKNEEDKVEGTGFGDIVGYEAPELKKDYPFVKTANESKAPMGLGWAYRTVAALAPNPAALLGMIGEIRVDPMIQALRIGAKTGSNTGIRLTENLVSKEGQTVLPATSRVALSELGKDVIRPAIETEAINAVKAFNTAKEVPVSQLLAEAGVDITTSAGKKFLKKMTSLMETNSETYARQAVKELTTQELSTLAKSLPYKEAQKLVDLGGISIMDSNIIPGYQIERFFDPIVATAETGKYSSGLIKALWTNKNIPVEFRPNKAFIGSATQSLTAKGIKLLNEIEKPLGKQQLFTFDRFLKVRRDIFGLQAKVDMWIKEFDELTARGGMTTAKGIEYTKKIQNAQKLIDYGKSILPVLDDKVTTAVTRYDDELIKGLITKSEREFPSIKYPTDKAYTPIRETEKAIGEKNWWQRYRSSLGIEVAPFQQEYKTGGYLEALKKGDVTGFEKVGAATGKRIYEGGQRVGRALTLDEMKQFGILEGSKNIPKGWVEARDLSGKLIPELRGFRFPIDMAKVAANVKDVFFGDKSFIKTIRLLDDATNLWKRIVLATPGYHLRNFYSDIASGFTEYGIDFLNPKYWIEAQKIKMAQKVGGKFRNVLVDVAGVKRTAGEMADELTKSGSMGTGRYVVETASGKGSLARFSKANPLQWNAAIGAYREDMGRIVADIIERNAGSDMIQAAWNVKKVFFDYGALTAFERGVLRRAIPFYSWTRKNVVRQIEALITRPGRVGQVIRYMKSIEKKDKPAGYDFIKPEYFNELNMFLTNAKSKEGLDLALYPNIPLLDLGIALNPMSYFAQSTGIYSDLNPMLKVLFEAGVFREEAFTGKSLGADGGKEPPKEPANTILNALLKNAPKGFLESMNIKLDKDGNAWVTPMTNYLFKQNPVESTVTRLAPQEESPKTPYNWESLLTGVKKTPYDQQKQLEQFYNRMGNKAGTAISDKAIELGQPELGTTLSADRIGMAYKRIYADFLTPKYPKYVEAQKIRERIKYEGGGSKDITLMLNNMEKPYNDEMAKIKGMTTAELYQFLSDLGINPTMQDVTTILNKLNAEKSQY